MARVRQPSDWERDLAAARPVEAEVARALEGHPEITHFSDFTKEFDDLDFVFRFEGERTRVDVKEKRQAYSAEITSMWPEIPAEDLLIIDETSFRALMWSKGLGYLLIRDVPQRRWVVMGPWELCLGPRRRFEWRGDRGHGEFVKGKLLVDLRTAAATSDRLPIDALLDVVRESRRALRRVRAITVPGRSAVPIIPAYPDAPTDDSSGPGAIGEGHVGGEDRNDDPRWAGLDPTLVLAIKSKWGWDEPTPIQRSAFPAVLAGDNVLILAPTAGGKTEAALLPVLDELRQGSWEPTSVLVISPLKALLDDQLIRYRKATALTGTTVFAWHGDIGQDQRHHFLDAPADILLTTPESIERLLIRPGSGGRPLFGRVRAVIVDEVHTFCGTARGAQLAALLERIEQHSTGDIQRIGLSATVGDPRSVLGWLSGSSLRDARLVQAQQVMKGEELAVFAYESLQEATSTIRTLISKTRALIFTPSRRRAEQLGNALELPVHHSSVAAGGRSAAINQLISGNVSCVVATASLEMGIDIGDIELVVNDGAPPDPGSYLQRLGRSGRQTGNRRMALVVGDPDSLLLALAVIARARRDELDTAPPGRGARLILGQQILALAFERSGLRIGDVHEFLRWSPTFSELGAEIDATIAHLVEGGWLATLGDFHVIGPRAQARFGGNRFVDLLATFDGSAGAVVIDENGTRIGTLDWGQVVDDAGDPRPEPIVLAGKGWTVQLVNRSAGTVTVSPSAAGRVPSWKGPSQEVGRATWEAAREILAATEVPTALDERAARWLTELRTAWSSRLANPVREETGMGVVVDGFAGVEVHSAFLATIDLPGKIDGPTCYLHASRSAARAAARQALADWASTVARQAGRAAAKMAVRHRELVAPSVIMSEAIQYHVDSEGLRAVIELTAEG